MFEIISYYNFVSIVNLPQFLAEQKRKCKALNLKGRIYIAQEGINGILAGEPDKIGEYKNYLSRLKGFEDTEFKSHQDTRIPFWNLKIKIRPEIVALKTSLKFNTKKETGKYLTPQEWKKMLSLKERDYLLLDVRNSYETKIGHFEGAILPDLENFYDFPKWLDKQNFDKGKKVLMYCTGGIRCEKFSAFMKQKGFKDIYQLKGGILHYAQQEEGKYFKGKCFVFDDRLKVNINENQNEPISKCEISGIPCDSYINCANMRCNKLFICSKDAAIEMQGCCSEKCKNSPYRRPFNLEELYIPFRRWYKYFEKV